MSAPHIILDNLPSLCQKLSDLVEVWHSYNKNNFACFFKTRCISTAYVTNCYNLQVTNVTCKLDVSPLRQFAPGRFAPRRFAPGRIRRFLLLYFKPKHHRLDVFNYSCDCVRCHAELKRYWLTYITGETSRGRNVQRANWQRGEIVHKLNYWQCGRSETQCGLLLPYIRSSYVL